MFHFVPVSRSLANRPTKNVDPTNPRALHLRQPRQPDGRSRPVDREGPVQGGRALGRLHRRPRGARAARQRQGRPHGQERAHGRAPRQRHNRARPHRRAPRRLRPGGRRPLHDRAGRHAQQGEARRQRHSGRLDCRV